MTTEQKIEEISERLTEVLSIVKEERQLNNARFAQLSAGLSDVRRDIKCVQQRVDQINASLNAKIDHVYDSLSQDIQVFADDLSLVKRRATRPRKKVLKN